MKILHLVHDWMFDNATIAFFLNLEKSCGLENRFVVLRRTDDKVLYKIASQYKVDVVQMDSAEYEQLRSEKRDAIWVHGLTDAKAQFVLSLSGRPHIVWGTWGWDYVRFAGRWLYGMRTTRLWLKGISRRSAMTSILTYLISKTPWVRFLPDLHCRFFRTVDFYSTVVPEEEALLSHILRGKAKRISFHYYSKKDLDISNRQVDLSAKRIWIGNSATLSNNHLDVLPILEKNKGFELHLPLAYSTTASDKIVGEAVEKYGTLHFGGQFFAHKEFLPFDDYIKLMERCALFVFAHRRQQSAGNATLAFGMGGCVVMDERNPIFHYVRRNGICVYSLSNLKRHGVERLIEDFKPNQLENMRKAKELWNYERMMTDIKHSINFLREQIGGENSEHRSLFSTANHR